MHLIMLFWNNFLGKQLPLVTLGEDFILKKYPKAKRMKANCSFTHGLLHASWEINLCGTNGIKADMPRASSLHLQVIEKNRPLEEKVCRKGQFISAKQHLTQNKPWFLRSEFLTSCIGAKDIWNVGSDVIERCENWTDLGRWQIIEGWVNNVNSESWSSSNDKQWGDFKNMIIVYYSSGDDCCKWTYVKLVLVHSGMLCAFFSFQVNTRYAGLLTFWLRGARISFTSLSRKVHIDQRI